MRNKGGKSEINIVELKKGGFLKQLQKDYFAVRFAKPQENDLGFGGVIRPEFRENDCISCGLCADICPAAKIPLAIEASLGFFREHGKSKERFGKVIERIGWEKFRELMERATE